MEKKQLMGIVVLIVIVLLGYFGWQMWSRQETDSALFAPKQANPFEENANPYENIKTNPFE